MTTALELHPLQRSEPGERTIPTEAIAWQGVVDARPEYSIPFAVEVLVLHTAEQLQAWVGRENVDGHSLTYLEPDENGIGAVILLTKTEPWLSIVAHEVAHIALLHLAHIGPPRIGARRWLHEHPEYLAEMIGNLTSELWYAIPTFEVLSQIADPRDPAPPEHR